MLLLGLIFKIFNLLITFEINLKSKPALLSKQRKIPFIIMGCILLLCGTFLMINLMLMPNVYFDFRNPLSMYYKYFTLPWNYAIISILISGFLTLTCAESKSIGKRLALFIMIPVTIGGCGFMLSCLINKKTSSSCRLGICALLVAWNPRSWFMISYHAGLPRQYEKDL